MYNQPLFEIPGLSSKIHKLTVTYNGPAAPLVFDSLEVKNGDAVQSLVTPEPEVPGDNPSSANNPSSGKKAPLGAIVGGAVGGAVFLLSLLALFLIMKRRKKKQRAQAAADAAATITPLASPGSPLSPMYEVKPLRYSDQSPPTTSQTLSNSATGDSLPHGPMPAFYGHHSNNSTSSNTGGQPFNPSAHHSSAGYFGPLAPAAMNVSYPQNGHTYSRAPEPMA
jgi:hypothetical protein